MGFYRNINDTQFISQSIIKWSFGRFYKLNANDTSLYYFFIISNFKGHLCDVLVQPIVKMVIQNLVEMQIHELIEEDEHDNNPFE